MGYVYAVLGAGAQVAAAAYDLVRWGEADQVLLVDDGGPTAERVNAMLDSQRVRPVSRDALLEPVHRLQLDEAGLSAVSRALLEYALQMLDEPLEAWLWEGCLPQHPRPPFRYLRPDFSPEPATFVRDGRRVEVPALSGLEEVDFPPVGRLEAFVWGGELGSYEGRLRRLEHRTLRYPGHCAQLRAYRDLGLWDTEAVPVQGREVVPRQVFQALFEPRVSVQTAQDTDMVLVRVQALGRRGQEPCLAEVELLDYQDPQGFTALERCAGWGAAIVCALRARGELTQTAYVAELRRRGLQVRESLKRPSREERMHCPRDGTALESLAFLGTNMLSCPRCFGMLLPAGKLAKLHGDERDLPDDDPALETPDPDWDCCRCPHCQAHMQTRWFSAQRHVLVDRCLVCGDLWLDRDELKAVL